MNKINIDIGNCYGIKALTQEFDFTNTRAYAIYAPNGSMKSSLAKTFQDIVDGQASSDRIFPARTTTRSITDEHGTELSQEQVLVVHPYDEEIVPNERTSTLLVDAKLRKEYAELHAAIKEAEDALLQALKDQSRSKTDFRGEVSSAFTSGDGMKIALMRIQTEIQDQDETPFADVHYDTVFNDKVVDAFAKGDLQDAIEDYVKRYNELLAASNFFKRGTFDYYNAGQIAKSLTDNGFFKASHTVSLRTGGERVEISTQEELEEIIEKEKKAILHDEQLRKKFDAVAKKLGKNAPLRNLCAYLQENEPLLPKMGNLGKFREDVLKSYLKANEKLYLGLMAQYAAAKERGEEIQAEARKQRTEWERVIEIFNDRFHVPFELEAANRTAVMLGDEDIIELGFIYRDGDEFVQVQRETLLQALSNGEKKAFYILNVLFEIQTRRKAGQETLIIVDDLADSFDYHNKYAIIQYLKDVSEDGLFKQIMMTHNFDFFRTVESRFVSYSNCFMAQKSDAGVLLQRAAGIKNVFVNDWKKNFFLDDKKKIASIPFLRNLVEFSKGDDDQNYKVLTSMLHWKDDSAVITVEILDNIYNEVCAEDGVSANTDELVFDLITKAANACLDAPAGMNFENKIVLAIATRLHAERFVVDRIDDAGFVASISHNQTQGLVKKFKEDFSDEVDAIKVLDRVALMTPENIHLNSFMYEPIVDMSDEHLKALYRNVMEMINGAGRA